MTQIAAASDWLEEWRTLAVDASDFQCRPMDLSASSAWGFGEGSLRHQTGRFFSVIGVEENTGVNYPLIDQPDVGLLGFIVAGEPGQNSWLAQMKVEPGNVGVAQLAPTLQATQSNLDRVHAGNGPPLEQEFLAAAAGVVSDGLWSEQASRFLGKRNRNVTLRQETLPGIDGTQHRWITSRELRAALATDFAVNTDARSVIATTPWRLIGPPRLFEGELRRSYLHLDPDAGDRIRTALATTRPTGFSRIPLEDLPDAQLDQGPVPIRHPRFDVVHRSITASTREVPRWDQPLVAASGPGRIDLLLRHGDDGVLRALLAIDSSAGLTAGPELTATRVDPPGASIGHASQGEVIAMTQVSDEGGRFDHAVSTVTIAVVDSLPGDGFVELSLGDLELAVRTPMRTTNELRTAVAQLLALG